MKILLLFVVLVVSLAVTVVVKAQSETDGAITPSPEYELIKFQEKGLGFLVLRISTGNLPDDLLTRALDILLNTQIQLDACKVAYGVNHIVWQYKMCIITQLKTANAQIKILENEATNRLSTTTTTSPTYY